MKPSDVYEFYHTYLKPIYSEIEARNNRLPVELLFETFSAFDHLKRIYIEKADEAECCQRAFSHLKRGVLDAFKLKLKYFNDDVEKLLNSGIDFSYLDNGTYLPKMLHDKEGIHQIAMAARLAEAKHDINIAFEKWCETSLQINQFEQNYLAPLAKIEWAKRKTWHWLHNDTLRGLVIGVASSIVASALLYYFIG